VASMIKITGMSRVLSNLKKSKLTIAVGVARGLKQGGLFLQRESQKIVPVDTTNLKGGAFTRNIGGNGFDADVVVGYVADYAVYVHENLQAKHKPGKQAKFLEQPAREKRGEIIKIIEKEARK